MTIEPSTGPHKQFGHLQRAAAREISQMSRYYDRLIQLASTPEDEGLLLRELDSPDKSHVASIEALPDLSHEQDERSIVLLNGLLNHNHDIEGMLTAVRKKMSRSSRVVIVSYSPYQILVRSLFQSRQEAPSTFFTLTQLRTIARLAGLEIVRVRPTAIIPIDAGPLARWLERSIATAPGMNSLSSAWIIVMRSTVFPRVHPSLSVVIPARNERGNIEPALQRLRDLNREIELEILFVEGHSSDATWDEILRVQKEYAPEFNIRAMRQTGTGKADAVRLGFANAKKQLLTILDADLTMPPELLHRFYDAYCAGLGDFINGDRLLYPMEGEAMRPLNRLGNIFFAKTVGEILDTPLGDTLCGTKLMSARDYARIMAWRADFGDFDPFGDFELLFPAAVLGLRIVDVPIRYLARQYGATNIHRFRHGAMLLKMTAVGLRKIKWGAP